MPALRLVPCAAGRASSHLHLGGQETGFAPDGLTGGLASQGQGHWGGTARAGAPAAPHPGPPGTIGTMGLPPGTAPQPLPTAQGTTGAALGVDKRVSGLGPRLTPAQLQGGWAVTREVWDRAAAHPNATLLSAHSPRLVLVRDFLSAAEIEHLLALTAGELVATGSGAWSGACHLCCQPSCGEGIIQRRREPVLPVFVCMMRH